MNAFEVLLRKDLRIELRTKESVPAMLLFAVTTFVLFHFGLGRNELAGHLAAGVFWVTFLFAALLGTNRLLVAEQEAGGLEGILLTPASRSHYLFAKVAALTIYLTVLGLGALGAFGLLLAATSLWAKLPELLLILFLTALGSATIGTLVATLASQTRARELLVALLGLPLFIPLLIAAAEASTPLLAKTPTPNPLGWLSALAICDTIFLLIAYSVFDFLLEE